MDERKYRERERERVMKTKRGWKIQRKRKFKFGRLKAVLPVPTQRRKRDVQVTEYVKLSGNQKTAITGIETDG